MRQLLWMWVFVLGLVLIMSAAVAVMITVFAMAGPWVAGPLCLVLIPTAAVGAASWGEYAFKKAHP